MVPGTNHKVMPVSEQLSMFEINEPGANKPFAVIVEIGPPGDLSAQHIYENAINAYTKGPLFCVLFEKDGQRVVHKYPLASIFRVIEDYPESKR